MSKQGLQADVIVRPPRLHWAIVLLLSIVTLGLFAYAWLIVQCNWVRKVRGKSLALPWAVAYVCLFPALMVLVILIALVAAAVGSDPRQAVAPLLAWSQLFGVVYWIAILVLRGELAVEPIRVRSSRMLTYLFGIFYLQYRIGRGTRVA